MTKINECVCGFLTRSVIEYEEKDFLRTVINMYCSSQATMFDKDGKISLEIDDAMDKYCHSVCSYDCMAILPVKKNDLSIKIHGFEGSALLYNITAYSVDEKCRKNSTC